MDFYILAALFGCAALAAITAVMGVAFMWFYLHIISKKCEELDGKTQFLLQNFQQLQVELDTLKDKRRHPYPTADGLEDAIAIANDIAGEAQAALNYIEGRESQLLQILKVIRADPHSYKEKPNRKVIYEKRRPGM